jgi:hypothetical protein
MSRRSWTSWASWVRWSADRLDVWRACSSSAEPLVDAPLQLGLQRAILTQRSGLVRAPVVLEQDS